MSSRTRIVFREEHWDDVLELLNLEVESAAVLLAKPVSGPGPIHTFLVREVIHVPDDAYLERTPVRLSITSPWWVPALGRAAADLAAIVFLHTHPGGSPELSSPDVCVDANVAPVAARRTRARLYASLVLGGSSTSPRIDGQVIEFVDGDARTVPLDAVRVVGRRLRIFRRGDTSGDLSTFDRQVRAFGREGQALLSTLSVGIVGQGGTGSAVREQLVRLGVGAVTLLDPKLLSSTNVTRVYGSSVNDVDRPKVEVAADHVRQIGLGTEVTSLEKRVDDPPSVLALRHCDVIFGCTDDNAGRLVLSRLPYWYLVPLIDLGVIIDSTAAGEVRSIYIRITIVGPGAACLLCRGRIDQDRARVERLEPDERDRLAREGYVPGLAEPDPAVVPFTTLAASLGVTELLSTLFGFGDESRSTELMVDVNRRRISRNTVEPVAGHFCARPDVIGAGDAEPLLDRVWA